MKNIFVIPTTELSQVYLIKDKNTLGLTSKNPESMEHYGSGTHNQHIYITNKESYAVGDWCIEVETGDVFKVKEVKEFSGIVRCEKDTYVYDACAKIVITTDLKLVADGVKEADLEFLSWLSSFPLGIIENVMVEKMPLLSNNGRALYGYSYKAVIFKESLQQTKRLEEAKYYDKFNQILSEGDYVDVQKDGVQKIYKKDDNQLYFKPYGEEDKVSAYFSNDLAKCDENGNWINNDRYEDIKKEETPTDVVLEEVLFKKGDKVLFTGKMLDEFFVNKLVTVFYTLGKGAKDDMSDIMDEYTHIYRVWNKDLKHISKEESKKKHIVMLIGDKINKESNIINDWLEENGNPEIAKQVEEEAEELLKKETLEQIDQNNLATRGSTALVYKQSTKDRIISETSEEQKQKARDYGNSLVNKQETLEKNLKSLYWRWHQRQVEYERLAEKYRASEHNFKKFTYKAIATRDCWKELLKLIENEK